MTISGLSVLPVTGLSIWWFVGIVGLALEVGEARL